MRVLIAHNRYQQRGGEDVVFELERDALIAAGFQVETFVVDNDRITGLTARVQAVLSVAENRASVNALKARMAAFAPDLVHFHNIFPLLSPAALGAAAQTRAAVLHTVHNYRALCANGLLLRQGRVCELCVGGARLHGVAHRCYRGSALGSAAVGFMGEVYKRAVARHPASITLIALTDFARAELVKGGLPADQIVVKGNAGRDRGPPPASRAPVFLFVGRLSPEKGCDLILKAAAKSEARFEIIGDGPDRARLQREAPANVEFLGILRSEEVAERMARARALLVPSRWYENFPMVIVEAFAAGAPVIASDMGALPQIIDHGRTGLIAPADDLQAWGQAIDALSADDDLAERLSAQARAQFLATMSEAANVQALGRLYEDALARRGRPA